jgi:cytosine deaminase
VAADPNENRDKYFAMLQTALAEARAGLAEVQQGDPSAHGETDAFRQAGRQRTYRDKIMATTLAPCWYCSGLIRQFGIATVVVGESVNFRGGMDWLRENGIEVIDLGSRECADLLAQYVNDHPEVWKEDIGEE